jgi:hypothetical protein
VVTWLDAISPFVLDAISRLQTPPTSLSIEELTQFLSWAGMVDWMAQLSLGVAALTVWICARRLASLLGPTEERDEPVDVRQIN